MIMPYKSEKIPLNENQDRRRKLTSEQKEEIKNLYKTGFYSLNSLAKRFGVSKKLILLIVNPVSSEKNKQRIKERWRDYQADKEERARVQREHRRYKQSLYVSGKLKDD